MSDVVHVKKSFIVVIAFLVVAFVFSLVIGYGLIKDGQKKENCWDNYTTEREAIMNCEGEGE